MKTVSFARWCQTEEEKVNHHETYSIVLIARLCVVGGADRISGCTHQIDQTGADLIEREREKIKQSTMFMAFSFVRMRAEKKRTEQFTQPTVWAK